MSNYKAIKYNFSGAALTDIVVPPTIGSILPTSSTEGNLPTAITITGSGFISDSTVKFIGASGTTITAPSVTFNSATELVATAPTGVGGVNEDPWDVLVENPVQGQGDNLFTIDDNPIFTTAAGTLGSIIDSARAAPAYTLAAATATDPEGVTVSYSLVAPGPAVSPGLSFDATNAAITGTADAVGGDTTTTFTVRATAGAQTADRIFSILVKAPVQTYFTVAGAATEVIDFSAPIKILVVGGGGSGDSQGHAGGGGGGGLIVHPSYSVTPQTYGYYIGAGGVAPSPSTNGENSNWGINSEPASTTATILTGLGGGKGTSQDGGSGGGKSHSNGPGGLGVQTNSPLISADAKTYGFGNNGGSAPYSPGAHPSGGGGGAGAAGQAGQGGSTGGAGGGGKDVSTDFGTAQGSPGGHFAGGGGGGCHNGGSGGAGANGGGNGAGTGNSGPGNPASNITGSGGGAGAVGGNGVIAIAY